MEEIIKSITVQVLNMLYKRVLIFVTGGAVNINDIFNTLKDFKYIKYTVVISESAKEIIPKEYFEALNVEFIDSKDCIVKAIKNSDFIMVPVMSKNTLSKSALGIRDTYLLSGISEALMRGKKIITVKDSCDPCNSVMINLGLSQNKSYNNMILNYMKTLESFGMEFVDSKELKATMSRELGLEIKESSNIVHINKVSSNKCFSGVITRGDLNLDEGVKEIDVKLGSIVTPFAKDYLESIGIKINHIS